MKLEFTLCLQKAQAGDPQAQRELGHLYRQGEGVAKDETQAVEWYQKAAEAGDRNAQFYLGRLYEEGRGVAKDEAQALQWYLKAACNNKDLAEGLRASTTLTSISFYENEMGPEGVQMLAEALKINTTLTSIGLSNNYIRTEGVQVLAEALKINTTLTSIDLSRTGMGPEGMQALAEALKTNTTLTSINLYNNQMGPKGVQALAEALKTNTTLTSTGLSAHPFDPAAPQLQVIETLCKRNKALAQAAELYALIVASFPTEEQDAYLRLKEATTSSTSRPIVRFFQMAGKLPDDLRQGLAYQVYDQARDFIPSKAKASAANKLVEQLREEDIRKNKMVL